MGSRDSKMLTGDMLRAVSRARAERRAQAGASREVASHSSHRSCRRATTAAITIRDVAFPLSRHKPVLERFSVTVDGSIRPASAPLYSACLCFCYHQHAVIVNIIAYTTIKYTPYAA